MTGTYQFIPHHRVAEYQAEGWTISDNMADVHHGDHSVLMQAPVKPQQMSDAENPSENT